VPDRLAPIATSDPAAPAPAPAGLRPHAATAEDLLDLLGSTTNGLGSAEAAARLERFGPNRLEARPGTPAWRLLLDEFLNPLVLILLGAVAVLVGLTVLDPAEEHWRDAALILAIVLLNAALGFIQNYRAQRGIEALERLAEPVAHVLRDGRPITIGADALVPGDVVQLEEGDRIPADGRILRAHDLRIDESSLTGESLPVHKTSEPVPPETPLAERVDMVYGGTVVAVGRGRFAVVATGMATEIGAIAEAVQSIREGPTPFQREVAELGRRITLVIGALIMVIAGLHLSVGGLDPLETFVAAVALAVAAIPEGLPVVMTLALAFGTRRMLERRALVRSLPVVEIVGGADVICSDKTGTITEGRMSLRRLWVHGREIEVTGPAGEIDGELLDGGVPVDLRTEPALLVAALCNNAHHAHAGEFVGDPTDVALLVGALKAGVDLEAWDRVEEIPFSSDRRRMSVVVERDGEQRVLVKGAPEEIVARSVRADTAEGDRPLDDADRSAFLEINARLAGQGFRVIALAGKPGPADDREAIERDLVLYGLAALADPPRAEAGPALQAAGRAGIRTVMITGDNPRTAAAIGQEIGLAGRAVTGMELEEPAAEDLLTQARVFARVEPRHKLAILEAYRARGHVVVMTGDGVNDAPALKGADVGIAMGVRGTDVARDASDMVLLDDNFATIVAAVEEGRRITANIRKFLNYLLTGNLAEVLLILFASFFGLLPLTAVQILWVNLVTDSGPAIALAIDPAAPGIMDRGPRRGPIIGRAMLALVASVGTILAAVVAAIFFAGLALYDLETARTLAFTALVAKEYLLLVVIRVHEGLPLLANRWLVVAVAVSLALQLVLLYTPVGSLFGAVPLDLRAWLLILAGLVVAFPAALGTTRLVRHRFGAL
jgi:Ca2+-transporting ATPase